MDIEKCDRCGNEQERDGVYYCGDCDTYFCDSCIGDDVGQFVRAASQFAYHSFCPECDDGGYIGRVGTIVTATSDEVSEGNDSDSSDSVDSDDEERDGEDSDHEEPSCEEPSHEEPSYEDPSYEEPDDDDDEEPDDDDDEEWLRALDGLSRSELDDLCGDADWGEYASTRIVMNQETNICSLAILEHEDGIWEIEGRRRLNEIAASNPDLSRAVQRARQMNVYELTYLAKSDPDLRDKLAQEDAAARRHEAILAERRANEEEARKARQQSIPPFILFILRILGVSDFNG